MKQPNETGRARRTTFFGGVMILAVANILVKLFGFIYKVPLNRMLGDEMANVNAAYSVYTLLYMLSTAGIPVAVSVLVSETVAEGRAAALSRIFRVSLVTLAVCGALGTAGMLIFAAPISEANSGGDSFLCLLAIAPALFFICISSVLRGYFQGFGRMTPTAISGIIEAFGKMLLGLLLVHLIFSLGGDARLAAGYSVLGITVGIALGALYLATVYCRDRRRGAFQIPEHEACPPSVRSVEMRLLRIAVPIALSSGVLSLASLIDGQMMRPLLEEYYGSAEMAKAVFSDYTTGAVTLFNMPAVLVYPIASAIVPYMTAARARGDHTEVNGYISSALRIAALISLPASLGMSILARPILSAVFLGDADMASNAGEPLALLAISIFPLALLAVTNAILQALGKQGRPILSMVAGVAVKLTVLALATPVIGPLAAPLGTLGFYLVALLFNFYFVFRYTAFGASLFRIFIPPTLSALLSSLAAFGTFLLFGFLGEIVALGCGIVLAVIVYLVSVLFLGGVDASDLALFPHTERIRALLFKYHFIRSER